MRLPHCHDVRVTQKMSKLKKNSEAKKKSKQAMTTSGVLLLSTYLKEIKIPKRHLEDPAMKPKIATTHMSTSE